MQETQVQSLHWEEPKEKEMQPAPVLLPEKSHGQRSLVGYSPWSCKESDVTEQLNTLIWISSCILLRKHKGYPEGRPLNLTSHSFIVPFPIVPFLSFLCVTHANLYPSCLGVVHSIVLGSLQLFTDFYSLFTTASFLFSLFKNSFIFYWDIVALQCC